MKSLTAILLGATALTVATPAPAEAAPVAAALLGFIAPALAASPLAVGLLGLGLSFAASIGLSLLQRALAGNQRKDVGGTAGKLQAGGIVPRSVTFGRYPASHSLVYGNSYGRANKTPNAYLVQVFQLGDKPIQGLAEFWVNGTKVTLDASTTNAPGTAYGGFRRVVEYFKPTDNGRASSDHLWVKFVDGSQTTADPFLVGQFGSDADYPYASTRIGRGCPYAIVIARYNPEVLSGFPTFKFIVDGARFYDPRLDSTAGGSGSHRWTDESTWAGTDNPVVVAYNIFRGIRQSDKWLFGGQAIAAGQLPTSSWFAAMNACDESVSLVGGGTEKRYRASGEINCSRLAADVVKDLMATCAGRISQIGGIYKIQVGAPGVAVMSITDGDILSTEAETFAPFKAIQDRANAVTGKYIEPAGGWEAKDAPPLVSDTYIAEDGKVSLAPLTFDFAPYAIQVQRLLKSALEENRRERKHRLPMPLDCWALEPGDTISWTSTRNGYTAKLFQVDQVNDGANHVVGLAITEVDPASYNWTPATDQKTVVAPPIVPVNPAAQPILDWAASPFTITGADGQRRPAIALSWDGDVEDVSGVQFEVWNSGGTEVVYAGETDRYDRGSIAISANLIGNTAYRVRGRYRPASPRQTLWSSYINVTTPDIKIGFDELDTAVKARIDQAFTDLEARVRDISQALQPDRVIRDGIGARFRAGLADDVERLNEAVSWLVAQQQRLEGAAIEAGLEINSPEGKARIRAVAQLRDDTSTRFNSVQVSLDALAGQISLIAGVNVSGLDGLTATISQVQTQLNATQASLANYVTLAQRTQDQAAFTTLSQNFDGLTATVATKANQTTVTGLDTRTTTVENNLSALTGNVSLLSQTVTGGADPSLLNGTLQDILGALVARTDRTETKASRAVLNLGTRIDDNGRSIAAFGVDLASFQANTAATFQSLTQTVADNNSASVSRDDALTASIAAESTARGQAIQSLSTRVTAAEGSITSQGGFITSLDNRLTSAEGVNTGQASAISGLQTTVTNQGGQISALSSSVTQVSTRANGISANGQVQIVAADVPSAGATASYLLRLTAGEAVAGLNIDAMSGGGSRVRFQADKFVIEGVNGAPSFSLNTTGSGARIQYENDKIRIFDAGGTERVRIGNLA